MNLIKMMMISPCPWISLLLLSAVVDRVLAQEGQQQELNFARRVWDSLTQTLPKTYYFQYQHVSGLDAIFSLDSYRFIRVEDNLITEVKSYTWNDDNHDASDYPTIDYMFKTIQSAIDEWSTRVGYVTSVQVTYDTTFGYPNSTTIEYSDGAVIQTIISGLTHYALEQQALNTARSVWNDIGLDNGMYQYMVQYSCFCSEEFLQPKNIQVEENEIVRVTFAATDIEYYPTSDYNTVSELFDQIQRSIENLNAYINIEYDPMYGYPTVIDTIPDYTVADAGTFIRTSELF